MPPGPQAIDDAIASLARARATTGVFVDFDGTLAPIVPDAAAARPLPGVPELLVGLAESFGVVAVVSGRPVAYLVDHLPPTVELHGLYGLERRREGMVETRPDAERWRAVVDEVAQRTGAEAALTGVEVEHKGLSLTLHFRRAPQAAAQARAWADREAARSGLDVRGAKMSLELHPPVAVDKGSIVAERSVGLTAATYLGDDVGDLPAFAALDRLRDGGLATTAVAVRTSESSPTLLHRADLEVDGPEGAVAFLQRLVP